MSAPERNGPERIEAAFARARARARARGAGAGAGARGAALVIYLMAGDPDASVSEDMMLAAARAGADVIEIGIPFSDPLADGPTIQAAGQRALAAGMNTDGALALAARLAARLRHELGEAAPPLVFMTYYNIVLHCGLSRFAHCAMEAGVAGVIVPDLPPEEADEWIAACGGELAAIFLVAPTSTPDRVALACSLSRGFVYAVSTTGVTGARKELPVELPDFVEHVRAESGLPVAVGFGVSSAEQAAAVGAIADGVIVGSAVIDAARRAGEECCSPTEAVATVVGDLAGGLGR